jgi:uncharacterized protein (DUF58 family)
LGAPEPTFPLISRRRGVGLTGGTRSSAHRGIGFEVASSRPYRRGDSVRAIDWKASARLSSARHSHDFIVREHFAEDRPRVVVVVDRRPEMSLYPPELPWLHKPAAVAAAGRMIVESAVAAQGLPGYLDLADPLAPQWLPPRLRQNAARIRELHLRDASYTAPPDNLARAVRHLARARGDMPPGTFVFILSDFLAPPPPTVWRTTASLGWDVVPVIVQDPRWEQSFPAVSGFALPLAAPGDGALRLVRLTRREAAERRDANERRLERLLQTFSAVELDPILLPSSDPLEILSAFLRWHEQRRLRLRRRRV